LKPSAALWRAGLPALGCEAVAKSATPIYLTHQIGWFWGRFATQRGQARSPQISVKPEITPTD